MKRCVFLYFFIFATLVDAGELFLLKYAYKCTPFFVEWCAQAPLRFPLTALYCNWKNKTVSPSAPLLKILAQKPQQHDQMYSDIIAYGCQMLADDDECDDIIINAARYENSCIIQGLRARNTVHVKNIFKLFTELLQLYDCKLQKNTMLMDMIDMLIQHKKFSQDHDYIVWCIDRQLQVACMLCISKELCTHDYVAVFKFCVERTVLDYALRIVDDACKKGLHVDDFLYVLQKRIQQARGATEAVLENFLEDLCLKQGKILDISDVVQTLYENNHDKAVRNIIKTYKNYHAKLLRFCMKTKGAEIFFSDFSNVDFNAIVSYRKLVLYFLRNEYDIFRHNKLFACHLIHHCLIKNDNIDDLLVKALSSDRYNIARTLLLSGAHIPEHELSKVIQHVCALDSGVVTLLIEYGYVIPVASTIAEHFDKEKLYYTRSLGDLQIEGISLKQKSCHNQFVRCVVDCWYALQGRYKVLDKIVNTMSMFSDKKLQKRVWHFIFLALCDEKYSYEMYQALRKEAFIKSKCTFGSLVASMHSSNFKRLVACIEDFTSYEKQKLFKATLRYRHERYQDAIAKCIVYQWNLRLHRLLQSTAFSDVSCICSI